MVPILGQVCTAASGTVPPPLQRAEVSSSDGLTPKCSGSLCMFVTSLRYKRGAEGGRRGGGGRGGVGTIYPAEPKDKSDSKCTERNGAGERGRENE